MSVLQAARQYITLEQAQAYRPGNTALIQAIGESINYIQNGLLSSVGSLASPVGTVRYSMLSLAQYQARVGSGWVLCDGGSCAGSDYATKTGASVVPLHCGRFLVGNQGSARGDGHGIQLNDGNLSVASLISDLNFLHNHVVNASTTAAQGANNYN